MIKDGEQVRGVLPLLLVKSWLTGNRMVSLPFSDVSYPLADTIDTSRLLVQKALELSQEKHAKYVELRGSAGLNPGGSQDDFGPDLEELGFSSTHHFNNYVIPLSEDPDTIINTFYRGQRQQIRRSYRLGVTARQGQGPDDLNEFYRLYLLNRRRFGIPPQPRTFFAEILNRLSGNPKSILYIAEYEGQTAASIIVLRYNGVCYGKYGAADTALRNVFPQHALLWKLIEDAAEDGDVSFDFGRTATDNENLNLFKSRWGTRSEKLLYYFHPPRQGLSVVDSDSLKYRLFTGTVRRLPLSIHEYVGSRIFRHFG
jgi:hypothetical protein